MVQFLQKSILVAIYSDQQCTYCCHTQQIIQIQGCNANYKINHQKLVDISYPEVFDLY